MWCFAHEYHFEVMSVVDLQQRSLQDCLLVFCRPHNNLSGAQSDHHGQAEKQKTKLIKT